MADLREDEQFHLNYPGACTISTKQVKNGVYSFVSDTIRFYANHDDYFISIYKLLFNTRVKNSKGKLEH